MDHDAHVKAYQRHQISKSLGLAVAYVAAWRIEMAARGYPVASRRKPWTWKNHLANWINKTLNLLEKWGL